MAARHFDAFVRGAPRPSPPYTIGAELAQTLVPISPLPTARPSRTNTPVGIQNPSYAQVAKQPVRENQSVPKESGRITKPLTKPTVADNHLFVRLSEGHSARSISGYALADRLRRHLGDTGKHIKEVLPVKSGLAICPVPGPESARALELLNLRISTFFDENIQVEKATQWQTVRIMDVPRSITVAGENNVPTRIIISEKHMVQVLAETTGATPTMAFQTASSAAAPHDPTASWLAKFSSETTPNLNKLRLF